MPHKVLALKLILRETGFCDDRESLWADLDTRKACGDRSLAIALSRWLVFEQLEHITTMFRARRNRGLRPQGIQ